jgi:PAS domain S-box-containing protein/putative nucleotidyltransferase with HDIG domain
MPEGNKKNNQQLPQTQKPGVRADDLTAAFVLSPIGIYIVQNRQFCFTNARFQEITGFTEKELLNKHPKELVHLEDRAAVREKAIQMLKGRWKNPYQYRCLTKDKEIKWILEAIDTIQYHGNPAVIGHFMDITESRRMESALQESEEKYHSLFQLAREGIVIIDYEDGRVLDSNLEFLNQTGYGLDSLKKRKIWELLPKDVQEGAQETFKRFREKSGGIISWKLCQRKKGTILPVEIAAQKMVVDGRESILCMVRDVTEREAMMRALTLASEEWRKCFDAIDDIILIIDHNFYIHRANMAAARLLNIDIREITGKRCHDLFHNSPTPPDYCPLLQAKVKGIYDKAEVEEPHLGRILHFSSFPMKDDAGEVRLAVEIISDVTVQKQSEERSVQLSCELAASFQGITVALSDLVESRDPYTAGHSKHVAELSVLVGKEMGFSAEDLHGLKTCSILHDIGKAIIPAAIMNKPGKLSEPEWGLIRAHPTTAFETLRHIPFPWPVAEVVQQHHERLDGSGYPFGLKRDQIHPWARIIAVADVLDAMISHRPYRPRLSRKHALDELVRGYDTLYDPRVADCLMRIIRRPEDRRVLVVDYEAEVLDALVSELQIEGYEASGFMDPMAAWEAFLAKPFPLVITEFKMPEMDGVELAQKIKEKNLPTEIMMLAKITSKEEMLIAIRAGVSDFIEKPLDLGTLRKSINRAFQRYAGKLI